MTGLTARTLIWIIVPLVLASYYSEYLYDTLQSVISIGRVREDLQYRIVDGPAGIFASTIYGDVKGKVLKTPNGLEFYTFLDIPYATPPVESLRFKRPLPPKPWKGILDATENKKICWNLAIIDIEDDPRQNEDCLYLNVYVPKSPSNKGLLPVMFYITGGMFAFNDGTFKSWKPYNFVERDIIMVAMNFRQGPLGLLTTNDGVIPGNLALWDQNMALKWVQKNIERFGGDPKKVTINGHSSGGAFATAHLLSKHSKGLSAELLPKAVLSQAWTIFSLIPSTMLTSLLTLLIQALLLRILRRSYLPSS
ncbi:unnamed protein product [Acanthoscelides obtectus]|uniref:Carboxylic ester hydrolase n=1 Tax=Acanthoscelides obtectus TaxID=200917 RepID=A0A9P0MCK4_ACAOB|nr:unnamed protein product [Acanthoscelides obtectus]CAK1688246.1 hypothetical protein AOBTE_LOCUS36642 [Acanthoscelides obtectus]